MLKLARTPRWILGLLVAFAIAAIFALLGQWQIGRAVESATIVERPTERVVPLTKVAEPQRAVRNEAAGQLIETCGFVDPGNATLLSGRYNGGQEGWWVVAPFMAGAEPCSNASAADGPTVALAVAYGWAPTEEKARDAAAALDGTAEIRLTGRYLVSEQPTEEDIESDVRTAVAVPALINQWGEGIGDVYSGYLVAGNDFAGLERIDSPAPVPESQLNWLNVFYAIEWVVFAAVAFLMWWRLLKDAYEREIEDAEEAAEEAARLEAALAPAER
jgi:cytochrome oxidase assembly protein ShyY1